METDRKILDQGCQFGTDDRSPEPRNRAAPPPSSLGRRRPGKDPSGLSHATDLSKGSLMTGWVSPDPAWERAGLGRCAAGVPGERAGHSTRVSWRPPLCSRIHFCRLKERSSGNGRFGRSAVSLPGSSRSRTPACQSQIEFLDQKHSILPPRKQPYRTHSGRSFFGCGTEYAEERLSPAEGDI